MKRFFLAFALSLFVTPVWAVGTMIPAPQRLDMVHDELRNVVYISNGDRVLRYDVSSNTMLSPITLGGLLTGIDISPDNKTLVVADNASSESHAWVHTVNLGNLQSKKWTVLKEIYSGEGGVFSAVYGADGNVYTTSGSLSSGGWGPLRRLDRDNKNPWTTIASVRLGSVLSASGDGKTIAFAEGDTSGGDWGLIDIPTGTVVKNAGTNAFNNDIATDSMGAQFAIPTYFGTFIYDDVYQKVATVGQYLNPKPIAVAYHPVERIAYFPWSPTQEVYVFDMNNFAKTGSYDFEDTFGNVGSFTQGRTRISRDGSLLMVSVTGGVRILRMYSPLAAAPVAGNAVGGIPVSIPLAGSIGNNGSLAYELVTAPSHGKVTLSGSNLIYTKANGFFGYDKFTYLVRYGRAVKESTVTVNGTK